ncbi:MAG: TIGR01777 family oxidoreductase [Chthoniobacter sp.]|nr:TIGR01777 family oxidoreductase [Chthoniobacter sp.]
MTIGLTGATGFIGGKIIDLALRRGHEIVAFTRDPRRAIPGCEMRPFSLEKAPDITGCEALIHLAGESVVGVWTAAKMRRITESRVLGTRRIVEAIHAATVKPEVLLCGSAIGFYGDRGDEELTETAPAGTGFLAETTQAWEREALNMECASGSAEVGATTATTPNSARPRVVLLRTAIVLGAHGGALPLMARPFRLGLGGPLGDGHQWVSWIHLDDLAQLALFAIENLDVRGPLNGSAPWPVRNADFTRALARTLHRPAFLRVPAFALRTALGGFAHELLDSKRVLPAAALNYGFGFRFPELAPALANLLG